MLMYGKSGTGIGTAPTTWLKKAEANISLVLVTIKDFLTL